MNPEDLSSLAIKRYPVGCETIDNMLRGGFEAGCINQIYGEGATGKTSMCLTFIRTTLQNNDGNVVFIDTEGVSPERVAQILGDDPQVMARVLFFRPADSDELISAVGSIKSLMREKDIKAIIIDSLTMFYRKDLVAENDGAGRKNLNILLVDLISIATRHSIPVVITNQVYMDPERDMLMPLGGNILAHNSKVIIELINLRGGVRMARLVKHRSIPTPQEARYRIVEDGIAPA